MAAKECNVEKYTQQNCGKPIVCTDTHHYRSEMVLGITNNVSYKRYVTTYQMSNLHSTLRSACESKVTFPVLICV